MATSDQGDEPIAPTPNEGDFPPSTSNAVRMCHAFDREMTTTHCKGNEEEFDEKIVEAERIAKVSSLTPNEVHADRRFKVLLEHADLHLVFRARACMILGLSSELGYVEWAEQAVRVAKTGIYADDAGPEERKLLEACEEVLRDAKADSEEVGGYEEEGKKETRKELEMGQKMVELGRLPARDLQGWKALLRPLFQQKGVRKRRSHNIASIPQGMWFRSGTRMLRNGVTLDQLGNEMEGQYRGEVEIRYPKDAYRERRHLHASDRSDSVCKHYEKLNNNTLIKYPLILYPYCWLYCIFQTLPAGLLAFHKADLNNL
jgi:hypothetical protein